MSVNIAGIDKIELVQQMWQKSTPALFFQEENILPPPMPTAAVIQRVLDSGGNFEYIGGRAIKTKIPPGAEVVDSERFNRANGELSLERIVEAITWKTQVAQAST